MRKPNLFIIWEPKCGTTIIHDYLGKHPDIFMSEPKELNYFATDLRRESENYAGKFVASLTYKYDDQKSYLNVFNHIDKKILWETSPSYARSIEAANNIYNFNKDANIIFCVREPISFLQSWHWHQYKAWKENKKTLQEALNLESIRKKGKSIPSWITIPSNLYYSEKTKFSEHLQRYLNYFSTNQIKIIIYEDFKNDNQKIINDITDFLWVWEMKIEYKQMNIASDVKYPLIKRLVSNSYKIRYIAQKTLPLSIRKKWGCFINNFLLIPKQKEKLSYNERKNLMNQYKNEVININTLLHKHDLIDKDIDLVKYWGYDKI